ncbi:MAG: aminotransferase class I/II-fold pyridoxal phosphate-dependent enzyme, partial [Chloroflexi bacterium]|nr:aminotransferase class I/II-fold pyridoxal phosphate-dependent enzyme [Chloroflexota bacterium]
MQRTWKFHLLCAPNSRNSNHLYIEEADLRIANRLDNVPPYVFAGVAKRIAAKQAQGIEVINLGIGSPDLPAPEWIVNILHEQADVPANHRYPSYTGMPQFRKAVATYYARRFDVKLNPDTEVIPLIGSKEGLANSALAYIDPGDISLVPDPGYPTYTMGTHLAGGTPYPVRLREDHNFEPDLDAIPAQVLTKAKVLWLNYPNNPTGATVDLDFYEKAVAFCRQHDLILISDNPYCDLTFDGYVAPSVLQVAGAMDVAIEINSLSKTYNMAGFRIGMAVGNDVAIEALTRVKSNVDTGIFNPIQYAGAAALLGDQSWLAGRNQIYQSRRDVLV